MSTFIYGTLEKVREERTPPEANRKSSIPGVGQYVDTMAALIPAEVLAFHAFAQQLATEKVVPENAVSVPAEGGGAPVTAAAGDPVTVISDPAALKIVFVVSIVAAGVLYWYAHSRAREHPGWDRSDWLRVAIPPLSFIVWTMLQKATAFDAVWPSMGDTARALIAVGLAIALGILAQSLAYKADGTHKDAPAVAGPDAPAVAGPPVVAEQPDDTDKGL